MGTDRGEMGPNDQRTPVILNLGCGFSKMKSPVINVDKFDICKPDVQHDLEVHPYPWADESVDQVFAFHIFEHLQNWWGAFTECARILRWGGFLEMRVPSESSTSAGTYRDHLNIISPYSFCGTDGYVIGRHNTNAWAAIEDNTVPMHFEWIIQVPHPKYNWILKWFPKTMQFLAEHGRNFIWEERYVFRKQQHGEKNIPHPKIVGVGEGSRK